MHHYRRSKSVERKLVLQNTDILGLTPSTVEGRSHRIDVEHVARSPRRCEDPVFVDTKSAELPMQVL